MKKYEYKIIEMKNKEKLLKSGAPKLIKMLNEEGEKGWRLVQIHYPLAKHLNLGILNVIFEREFHD
jgi:hypothetical protein